MGWNWSNTPNHFRIYKQQGLPGYFCRRNLPKRDEAITLIDEDGDEYPTVYLPRKTGLSGGWKAFAVAHGLVDGDALVFQLIRNTAFKVWLSYIWIFNLTTFYWFSRTIVFGLSLRFIMLPMCLTFQTQLNQHNIYIYILCVVWWEHSTCKFMLSIHHNM